MLLLFEQKVQKNQEMLRMLIMLPEKVLKTQRNVSTVNVLGKQQWAPSPLSQGGGLGGGGGKKLQTREMLIMLMSLTLEIDSKNNEKCECKCDQNGSEL